ncbi:uncharacterized protein [Musca autumnalis]|uniref:uncharacterized protein n=1 Tax=Musca autumnalis TaxID=221902 RepID=UPI003CED2173
MDYLAENIIEYVEVDFDETSSSGKQSCLQLDFPESSTSGKLYCLGPDFAKSSTSGKQSCLELDFAENLNSGKQSWLEAPVILMLSLLDELLPKVGKSAYLKKQKETLESDCRKTTREWVRIFCRASTNEIPHNGKAL